MGTLLVSASQYQISSTTLTKHQPRSYDLVGTERDRQCLMSVLAPAGAGKITASMTERRKELLNC